jgi:hypothetical protein
MQHAWLREGDNKQSLWNTRKICSCKGVPCLLGWTCRFDFEQGWSRHDLAMTWEWYASLLYVCCKDVGDLRLKLEVYISFHVHYADFYVSWSIVAVVCAKLPELSCLTVDARNLAPPKYVKTLSWSETGQIVSEFDKNWSRLKVVSRRFWNMSFPSQSEKCCILVK